MHHLKNAVTYFLGAETEKLYEWRQTAFCPRLVISPAASPKPDVEPRITHGYE
jgi:hypothetical protein